MSDVTDGQLMGAIILLAGAFVFLSSFVTRHRTLRLFSSGIRTSARVVDVLRRKMEGSTFYRLNVEFEGPDGGLVRTKTRVGSKLIAGIDGLDRDGSPLSVEVRVPVIYDPDRPKRVMVEAAVDQLHPERGVLALHWVAWGIVGLFVGAGLILMIVGGGDPICSDPDIGRLALCDDFGG